MKLLNLCLDLSRADSEGRKARKKNQQPWAPVGLTDPKGK